MPLILPDSIVSIPLAALRAGTVVLRPAGALAAGGTVATGRARMDYALLHSTQYRKENAGADLLAEFEGDASVTAERDAAAAPLHAANRWAERYALQTTGDDMEETICLADLMVVSREVYTDDLYGPDGDDDRVDDADKVGRRRAQQNRKPRASKDPKAYTRVFRAVSFARWFADRYEKLPPERRTYYEIIREGYAAKLYLDVEVWRELNPAHDSEGALGRALDEAYAMAATLFGTVRERCEQIVLVADNTRKFSRHVVINLHTAAGGAAFASASSVGRFVAMLTRRLEGRDRADGVPAGTGRTLHVFKPPASDSRLGTPTITTMLDLAVYSENQQFRLYGSAKATDTTRLLRTAGERADARTEVRRDYLTKSLVSAWIGRPLPPLAIEFANDASWSGYDTRTGARVTGGLAPAGFAGGLEDQFGITPLRGSSVAPPPGPARVPGTRPPPSPTRTTPLNRVDWDLARAPPEWQTLLRLHPFRGADPLSVRWFDATGTAFVRCGSRECAIAQRVHVSNAISLQFNLFTGRYRWTCFDDECKDRLRAQPTLSPWLPLSAEGMDSVRSFLTSSSLAAINQLPQFGGRRPPGDLLRPRAIKFYWGSIGRPARDYGAVEVVVVVAAEAQKENQAPQSPRVGDPEVQ
jgi:hypothetical protein